MTNTTPNKYTTVRKGARSLRTRIRHDHASALSPSDSVLQSSSAFRFIRDY